MVILVFKGLKVQVTFVTQRAEITRPNSECGTMIYVVEEKGRVLRSKVTNMASHAASLVYTAGKKKSCGAFSNCTFKADTKLALHIHSVHQL